MAVPLEHCRVMGERNSRRANAETQALPSLKLGGSGFIELRHGER